MYILDFSPQAIDDLKKLKKDEPAAFKKSSKLLVELQEHPETGTGRPEALSGDRSGQWSRRISQKHRLIYEIEEKIVKVDVLSAGVKDEGKICYMGTSGAGGRGRGQ